MRRGELVNLRWESIDLLTGSVRIESTPTFVTKWKKERIVPILVVKELLGHEKLSTTQIYAHVKHENLAEVVMKFDPR